jgi:ubiquitin carboxyl-terminal hydrolase 16/45
LQIFRSADKDDARYRLVGVIEHLGRTVTPGHFVAYVRGSRIVSEQELSSSSSSWFQANDTRIRNISLDDVLKREAFLLFYEKIKA